MDSFLEQARALPPAERAAWLTHLTATQPALAQIVQEMLAAEALTTLRPGAPQVALCDPLDEAARIPGLTADAILGGYRLIREIGYGGMSSVWLAERCDGNLQREVALKLPMLGPARMHLAERFRRERDILAALTHPNIARLYDAGISSSGQPYLAMEYIEGLTLVSHCEAQRLTLRERLHLFLQVLDAVQFAHARLIVHRDLKPSNILVTPHGRVVLLDFGIAKLLSEDAPEHTALTQLAGRPFTPDYASPEQITGLPLSTATDIYSLGVLLYELLTGQHPYGTHKSSLAQLQQAIATHDPPRPSQVPVTETAAELRRSTSRKLSSALTGDLDTVVLKALKKDPTERYNSVNAFAQDIHNHLHNLPVSARPDSRWYRLNRFVARHKAVVAAGSVALIASLAGAGVALWQMQVAAAQRDRALTLASRNFAVTELMGTLLTEAAESRRPVTISDMLERAVKLVRADTAAPPTDRAAVLSIIATQYNSVGDDSRTIPLLEEALALLKDTPDTGLRSQLRCAYAMHLADHGERDRAIALIGQELPRLADDPENAAYCWMYRATIAQTSNDATGALRYAAEGLARFRAAERTTSMDGGLFLSTLAFALSMNGRYAEADDYYRAALQSYARLARSLSPNTLSIRNNWAVTSSNAGVPRRALELYEETLRLAAQRDPTSSPPGYVLSNRARALSQLGRYRDANQAYQQALQVVTRQNNPQGAGYCLLGLAFIAIEQSDAASAAHQLQSAAEVLTEMPRDSGVWTAHTLLSGRLALLNGELDAARQAFDTVLAGKPSDPNIIDTFLGQAEADLLAGDAAAAAAHARQALELSQRLQGGLPYSNRTGLAWLTLARAAQRLPDAKLARRAFDSAVQHLSETVDANHPALLQARAGRSG